MKRHSQIGNRPSRPTYRTPQTFHFRNYLKVSKIKSRQLGKKHIQRKYKKKQSVLH